MVKIRSKHNGELFCFEWKISLVDLKLQVELHEIKIFYAIIFHSNQLELHAKILITIL